MKEFKYRELTKKINGAAMKLYSTLTNGFPVGFYQQGSATEFTNTGLLFIREFYISIFYAGEIICKRLVDFFKKSLLNVELKSRGFLEPAHFLQANNYLEAHNPEIGLLLNFGNITLKYIRTKIQKMIRI